MNAVTFRLGQEILVDWKSWTIALASIFFSFGFNKAAAFLIFIGGGLATYLLNLF